VFSLGYRYRLHRKELPGNPDLVFVGRRKVIFVHGCFWHAHPDERCRISHVPHSRKDYWVPKLERNKMRDTKAQTELRELGWDVLVLWECQLKSMESLKQQLTQFLGDAGPLYRG
jgi:DNA mismatch endonuclease, patch repair protein